MPLGLTTTLSLKNFLCQNEVRQHGQSLRRFKSSLIDISISSFQGLVENFSVSPCCTIPCLAIEMTFGVFPTIQCDTRDEQYHFPLITRL